MLHIFLSFSPQTHKYTSNRIMSETDFCHSHNTSASCLPSQACVCVQYTCTFPLLAVRQLCQTLIRRTDGYEHAAEQVAGSGGHWVARGMLRTQEDGLSVFGQCDSLKYQTAIVMCHALWVWCLHHTQQVELKVVKYHMVSKNEYTEWAKSRGGG